MIRVSSLLTVLVISAFITGGCVSKMDITKAMDNLTSSKGKSTAEAPSESSAVKEVSFSESKNDSPSSSNLKNSPSVSQEIKQQLPHCPPYKRPRKMLAEMGVVDKMLWSGIIRNDESKLREAIERGANFHKVTCNTNLKPTKTKTLKFLVENGYSFKGRCISFALPYRSGTPVRLTPEERLSRVKYLLTQGVDVNCTESGKYSALDQYYKVQHNIEHEFTETEMELFRTLLESGAKDDINRYLERSTTFTDGAELTESAFWSFKRPHKRGLQMLSILMDYGLDPNQQEFQIYNFQGRTFAHGPTLHAYIFLKGRPYEDAKNVFDKALEKGADVNKVYTDGSLWRSVETNLTSQAKGNDKKELYLLDNGGEYFEE